MDHAEQLEPLPYHREIVSYLQTEQRELWDWFSSNRVQEQHTDSVRLDLLKTTYRIEPETAPKLHELAHTASERLGLNVPITFYQSQRSQELNASLAFLMNEAHIVLHGSLTDVLSDSEILSVLGHELSHQILWTQWDGRYLIADQVLSALTNDAASETAHCESARLFQLYTEIFCDRGALSASGELSAAVAALVKIETGLKEVSAKSYFRQADEIFSSGETKTDGLTHPECFIRARALKLWNGQNTAAEDEIRRMIEGPPALAELDLLGQAAIEKLTRRLIEVFLSHIWMQSELVLGHARLFFEDFEPPKEKANDEKLAEDIQTSDPQLQDYYCYVLLDFVTTDRDLDEGPLAAAVLLVQQLKLADRFEPIVRKELGLRKKQFDKIRRDAEKIVARAGQTAKVP